MARRLVTCLSVAAVIVFLPAMAFAQEATFSGTVTDSTGGVLPGVAVTAVHDATGNTFETVTDARGTYRLPVRTGVYSLTAKLEGFAPITRKDLGLLLDQQATVNFQHDAVRISQHARLFLPS